MNVYRIKNDIERFQSIYIDDDKWQGDLLSLVTFDAHPRLDKWFAPPVYVLHPKLNRGNFFSLELAAGFVVADGKASQELEDMFEMSGELLPIPYEEEMLHVVNVTECINVLDQEKTKWHVLQNSATKIYIESFAFHASRFTETPLFKIPETCKTEIYTIERCGDPECEFKARVEQAGLTGLIFQKVWSDEGEPITVGP